MTEERVIDRDAIDPVEKFESIVSRWFPGFCVPKLNDSSWRMMAESVPSSPTGRNSVRGEGEGEGEDVTFTEDLSYAHCTGHEIKAGQSGRLAWTWRSSGKQYAAVWVDGILVYAVPVECLNTTSAALTEIFSSVSPSK